MNSPRLAMSLHSDTLSRFRANQYLLFHLNPACLAEKQQIPISYSLIWPDWGSNPLSITLEASTLTITQPMRLKYTGKNIRNKIKQTAKIVLFICFRNFGIVV